MRYSKQAATKALGLGCFLWLMLMALLSGALFGDIEEAAAFQTMLTTSFDGGVLAGFALCLVARRRRPGVLQSRRGRLSLLLIDACGLSTAVMLRAGMLFSGAPFDLVFLDPPYALGAAEVLDLLGRLDAAGSLAGDVLASYEHDGADDAAVEALAAEWGWDIVSHRRFGDTAVDFLERSVQDDG